MAFGAIMAGIGLASSIAGGIMSIFGRRKEMVAAREDFVLQAKEDAKFVAEIGERGLINQKENFRDAQRVTGMQVTAGASQGKGFSASSLIALSDTATKLARVNEAQNRDLNWQITQSHKSTMQKGAQTIAKIKGLKQENIAAGIGMVGQTAQALPGIVGTKKTTPKTDVQHKMDRYQAGQKSVLGNFGPMGTPGFRQSLFT